MIRIDSIKIDAKENTDVLSFVKNRYSFESSPFSYRILKKSIDSRDKRNICYVYSIAVSLSEKQEKVLVKKYKNISFFKEVKYRIPHYDNTFKRPVVIGAGPAGLFCAYNLCMAGLKPIIVERGASVDERTKDIDNLFENGILKVDSNVQFGEGGAGTFSDGKLNTGIKDKEGRIDYVLETFQKHGAKEDILYDSKPHIGTDILCLVIKNMRKEMESMGASYLFNTRFDSFIVENGSVKGINVFDLKTSKGYDILCDSVCLSIGHSARDTFYYLKNCMKLSKKSFAMGFRVIHKQSFINIAQYGDNYEDLYEELPTSPYKVTYTDDVTDLGVYSFCMCPGGYVVNASSEKDELCVNGMSLSDRASGYANSAIIVQINPDDYGEDVLSGVEFQRTIEKKAYALGEGKIPLMTYSSFSDSNCRECEIDPKFAVKGQFVYADLREVFPKTINETFIRGMEHFDSVIKDFARVNPLMAGVEARTSCPIRIERNSNLESTAIKGVFPCGEGAGYAGGIVSAAVDGIKVSEKIIGYGENYEHK